MNKVDKQIDVNLRILFEAPGHTIMTNEIVDPDDDIPPTIFEAKVISDKLAAKNLLIRNVERLDITDFGIEVSEFGGWLKYKEEVKAETQKQNNLAKEKAFLERKNLELSNENFEYQKTIRGLGKDKLILQIIIALFTIGGIIAAYVNDWFAYWF